MTGVFKSLIDTGGIASKSSPLTPSKTIFIPSLSPFSKPFHIIFTKTTTTFPFHTHENHFYNLFFLYPKNHLQLHYIKFFIFISNSFTIFILKNNNKIIFNSIFKIFSNHIIFIISLNTYFSLVKITYKNHKMSFNIIIYNIFNLIIFSFRLINLMISNIKMMIIIYNNSLCKFMINSNSRICRFRLILTTP